MSYLCIRRVKSQLFCKFVHPHTQSFFNVLIEFFMKYIESFSCALDHYNCIWPRKWDRHLPIWYSTRKLRWESYSSNKILSCGYITLSALFAKYSWSLEMKDWILVEQIILTSIKLSINTALKR